MWWEDYLVIASEEDDTVGGHFYDLDFIDQAQSSSRTVHETGDSGRQLILSGGLFVSVA